MLLSRSCMTLSRLISHQSRQIVRPPPFRLLSSSSSPSGVKNNGSGSGEGGDGAESREMAEAESEGGKSREMTEAELRRDAYEKLQNLDAKTAYQVLRDCPPKYKKFGFDFHLVQFFFACLPSLAVYLVAQHARKDMKKFEEDMEVKNKKKTEEEQKAKLAELESIEKDSGNKLLKVMERLDAIEEALKEIVHEKSKSTDSSPPSKSTDSSPPSKPVEQIPGPKDNISQSNTKK